MVFCATRAIAFGYGSTGAVAPLPTNARPFLGSIDIVRRIRQRSRPLVHVAGPRNATSWSPSSAAELRPRAAARRDPTPVDRWRFFSPCSARSLAWFIVHRLVAPLVELTGAAEAIAPGDYSERVTTHGSDEIGRLGAAFNRMAEQVRATSDESAGAVASLTKSVDTQQFLAEASRVVAGALSDRALLADLARLLRAAIADYCTHPHRRRRRRRSGASRRCITMPHKQDAVRELVKRYQYRVDDQSQVPNVIRIAAADARSAARPGGIQQRRRRGRRSVCSIASGRHRSCACRSSRAAARFGAMSFTMTDSGRAFSRRTTSSSRWSSRGAPPWRSTTR